MNNIQTNYISTKCDIFDDKSTLGTFTFDNSLNDLCNKYNLKLLTGIENYENGIFGGAFKFNGSTILENSNFYTGIELSVSLWFKPTDYTAYNVIFSQEGSNGHDNRGIIMKDNSIQVFSRNSSGTWQSISLPINSNDWYHIVGIWKKDGLELYVNKQKKSSSFTLITSFGSDFYIGRYVGTNNYYLNGLIDQFRIFNRILTIDEVNVLYNESINLIKENDIKTQVEFRPKSVNIENPLYPSLIKNTANICDIFNDKSNIALYEFEGNANDSCGNNNGTWLGDEQYKAGVIGNAMYSASEKDYINFGTNLANNVFNGKNIFTFSFWVKHEDYDNYFGRMIQIRNITTDSNSGIGISRNGSITSGGGSSAYDCTKNPNDLENNTWYHIVCISDGSNGTKIYMNGNLVASDSKELAALQSGQNFYIGYDNTYTHKGVFIDQLRIFNKALTYNEVQELYNENVGIYNYVHYPLYQDTKDKSNRTMEKVSGNINFKSTKYGYFAEFNGNSYIDLGDAIDELFTDTSKPFTINVKFYPYEVNNNSRVFDFKGNAFLWFPTNNNLEFSNFLKSKHYILSSVKINQWYNVLIEYDGNDYTFYLNGQKINYSTSSYTNKPPNPGNFIAKSSYSGDPIYKGLIGRLRIFDRILTDFEKNALFKEEGILLQDLTLYNLEEIHLQTQIDFSENKVKIDIPILHKDYLYSKIEKDLPKLDYNSNYILESITSDSSLNINIYDNNQNLIYNQTENIDLNSSNIKTYFNFSINTQDIKTLQKYFNNIRNIELLYMGNLFEDSDFLGVIPFDGNINILSPYDAIKNNINIKVLQDINFENYKSSYRKSLVVPGNDNDFLKVSFDFNAIKESLNIDHLIFLTFLSTENSTTSWRISSSDVRSASLTNNSIIYFKHDGTQAYIGYYELPNINNINNLKLKLLAIYNANQEFINKLSSGTAYIRGIFIIKDKPEKFLSKNMINYELPIIDSNIYSIDSNILDIKYL